MTGWWATAARALALVLALAMATPSSGLAEDLEFHQGHVGHDRTELAMASVSTAEGTQGADPGLACHVHCGCHVAVNTDAAEAGTPPVASRHRYVRLSDTASSVSPDRLPRPPRA